MKMAPANAVRAAELAGLSLPTMFRACVNAEGVWRRHARWHPLETSVAQSIPINIAAIVERTRAEGPGDRFAVWVQGCPLRCPGCCNPELLAQVPREALRPEDLLPRVMSAGVEGVSLLGGEPMAQAEALAPFAEGLRALGMSLMVYTGWTLAELRARREPAVDRILAVTDLLLDGRYDARLPETERRWAGSSNQALHFLTDRYDPSDPQFRARNTVEVRITGDAVSVNGYPILGAATGRRLMGA